jgi:hypothetical protein
LRIQENVVRVAIGLALEAFGFGPFQIAGNHFSSGGTVSFSGSRGENLTGTGTIASSLTVGILNLGLSIELTTLLSSFAQFFKETAMEVGLTGAAYSSSGTVLFSDNICQLEASKNSVAGFASVVIASLDHVLLANNHLWLNGVPATSTPGNGPATIVHPGTAWLDAFVFGSTIQVTSNRLQESALFPVMASGLTLGFLNITSLNISTYCLEIEVTPGGQKLNNQNLAYVCKKDKTPRTQAKRATAAKSKS